MKSLKNYIASLAIIILIGILGFFHFNKNQLKIINTEKNTESDYTHSFTATTDQQKFINESSLPDQITTNLKMNSPAESSLPIQPSNEHTSEKPLSQPPKLQNYSEKIPKLFSTRAKQNVDYYRPPFESDEHIKYFKSLADNGDAYGKFLYANRLWYSISKQFEENYSLNGKVVNESLWRSRYDEITKLYIEAAKEGDWHAASQLPVMPEIIEHDNIEILAWAMISDKIEGKGDNMLTRRCFDLKQECADELLTKATERALFYIDLYEFKTRSKPINN